MNSKKLLSIGVASASVFTVGFGSALSSFADVTYGNQTISTADLTARGLSDSTANDIIAYFRAIASKLGVDETTAADLARTMFYNDAANLALGHGFGNVVGGTHVSDLSNLKAQIEQLAASVSALNDSTIRDIVREDGTIVVSNISLSDAARVFKTALDAAANIAGLTVTTDPTGKAVIKDASGTSVSPETVTTLVVQAAQTARQRLVEAAAASSSSSSGYVSVSSTTSSPASSSTATASSSATAASTEKVASSYVIPTATPVVDAKKAFASIVNSKTPIVVELKTDVATWKFSSANLNKDQASWKNFDSTIKVSPSTTSTVLPKNVSTAISGKSAVVVDCSKNGFLPGLATVSVKLGDSYKGKEVYAYYISNGKFQLLTTAAKVDANGNVTLSLNHGCSFLIMEKSVAQPVSTALKSLEVK